MCSELRVDALWVSRDSSSFAAGKVLRNRKEDNDRCQTGPIVSSQTWKVLTVSSPGLLKQHKFSSSASKFPKRHPSAPVAVPKSIIRCAPSGSQLQVGCWGFKKLPTVWDLRIWMQKTIIRCALSVSHLYQNGCLGFHGGRGALVLLEVQGFGSWGLRRRVKHTGADSEMRSCSSAKCLVYRLWCMNA